LIVIPAYAGIQEELDSGFRRNHGATAVVDRRQRGSVAGA